MNIEVGIVLFLTVISIIPVLESIVFKRRRYTLLVYVFYFVINYFVLSAVKGYLGYWETSLFESFWDAQFSTFIHYGIPMIIIDIVAPIILKIILKDKDIDVIRYFVSAYFMTFSLCFLTASKVTNKVSCVAFGAAFIITLCSIRKIFQGSCKYIKEEQWKERFVFTIPFILLYFVTVVIYTPSELYLKNAADFPMPFWYYLGGLILIGVIVCAVLLLGMIVLMEKVHVECFAVIIFVLVTTGYIQGLFFNGDMGVLDGTSQNLYSSSKIVLNLVLWGVITAAVVLFYKIRRQAAKKVMKAVSIYIVLIQVVSLFVLLISSDKSVFRSDESVLTTDGMVEVSSGDNIIVLVLDKFDGRYMDMVLEDDPDFLSPLHDFTYYTNASSEFPGTNTGIPYLLSGTPFDEECDEEYVTYAYKENNLLTELNNAGYELGIYTGNYLVSQNMKDIILNYKDGISIKCDIKSMFSLMTRSSKYKMAPFAAKMYYVYDTSDIGLLVNDDRIVNILCDVPFYKNLVQEGLTVRQDGSSKAFQFIHMYGAHPPYTMTENFQKLSYDVLRRDDDEMALSQMRGSLKVVFEYIRQLKEIGKYDNALIFITADHGAVMRDENGEKTPVNYPILLFKEPYQSSDRMVYSKAPVCHADIIATIRKAAGINGDEKAISEYAEGEERIRYFYATSGSKSFGKYQIVGDVAEQESWKICK